MRRALLIGLVALLGLGGFAAATFAVGSGEHVACDTATAIASVPAISYSDGTSGRQGVIPGASDIETKQVCVTATDQTVTNTVTVTTPVAPPPPPPPTSGKLYVSPLGADANPCSQAQPCQSFARAYRAASCGNAVEVAAGNYPDQDIADDPAKSSCSSNVVLAPAAGASVTVGSKTGNLPPSFGNDHGLSLSGADHLTVSGFTIKGEVEISGSVGSVVENVNAVGGNLYVASPTQDVIVRGSSFGGTNRYMSKVWLGSSGQNVNLLLEGNSFHDVLSDNLGAYHVEGLLVIEENGITIRNNVFLNNAVFDLSLGECCGSSLAGQPLIQGNSFRSNRADTNTSLNLNSNTTRWPFLVVRGNDFARSVSNYTGQAGSYCANTGSVLAAWKVAC